MKDLVDKIRSEWSWEDFVSALSYVLDTKDNWLVTMAQVWAFDQWYRLFNKVYELEVDAREHGVLPDREKLEDIISSYARKVTDISITNVKKDLERLL